MRGSLADEDSNLVAYFRRLKAMFMGFSSEVKVKWFFFATEHTQIDFKKLKQVLERFDPTKVTLWFLTGCSVLQTDTLVLHLAHACTSCFRRSSCWAMRCQMTLQPSHTTMPVQKGRRPCSTPAFPQGGPSHHRCSRGEGCVCWSACEGGGPCLTR